MPNIITATRGYKYTNNTGSDIAAGSAVVNGALFGFAAATIAAGATGWIECFGVWKCPISSETANLGAVAYWDATNSRVTGTASTNMPIGYFVKAVASGDTECEVLLGVTQPAAAGSGAGG